MTDTAGLPPFLAAQQWRQVMDALSVAEQSGHSGVGEVVLRFQDGHPRQVSKTVSVPVRNLFDQLGALVEQLKAAGGEGEVTAVVRNGKVLRLEVTIVEPMIVPDGGGRV